MSMLSSFIGNFTGKNDRKAIDQSVGVENAGLDKLIALIQGQDERNQTNQAPFIEAGQKAVGQQGDLLGINGPEAQAAAIAQLQDSPVYNALFNNGQNTLLANASATGELRGGDTKGALAGFGRDTLSQVYQQLIANLGGVAGQGTATAATTGAQGAAAAAGAGGAYVQQAANTAGGIIGKNNSINSTWSNILQNGFFGGPKGIDTASILKMVTGGAGGVPF